jgi:tRNA(Ile)-lysidine synthase
VAAPFTTDSLAASLAGLIPGYPDASLCVALSGGMDSVALLHAAQALAQAESRIRLRAVHVDHGLQAQSQDWTVICRGQCQALGIPLQVIELHLRIPRGASVEAEARRARYSALAAELADGECLLTAHHADDQLETVLLQLFRGAGVAGLAAMPAQVPLGRGLHLRPLLQVERGDLERYAVDAGLEWIDDPMNLEWRYDRSYLRHEVLPAIRARWPAAARTVGRSARHFAAAQRLLEALAEADGRDLVDAEGRLQIVGLVALPRDRQVNVLRGWIVARGLGVPSTARLESILRDVVPARADAQPVVTWPTGEVRRYRGRLYAMSPLGLPPAREWCAKIQPGETIRLPCGLGTLSLVSSNPTSGTGPDQFGSLSVVLGVDPTRFNAAEQHSHRRILDRALRDHAAWARARLPFLLSERTVLAIGESWLPLHRATSDPAPPLSIQWDCPWQRRARRPVS